MPKNYQQIYDKLEEELKADFAEFQKKWVAKFAQELAEDDQTDPVDSVGVILKDYLLFGP